MIDNKSEEDRYVVIIDFWHPELTADERTALDFVYDTRNKFETGDLLCNTQMHICQHTFSLTHMHTHTHLHTHTHAH